jgi:hypothetical protein
MTKQAIQALENLREEAKIVDENPSKEKVRKYLRSKFEDETEAQTQLQDLLAQDYISYDENGRVVFKDLEEAKQKAYSSLDEVYNAYKEYYHIKDTKKVDLLLATALSVGTADKNIWMLFVGASGVGKSMLTNPLRFVQYPGNNDIAHLVSDITTNTIVSGQGGKENDLAPELDGKIMYVPDFSTVVGKRSEDQREIFSQLRNLYDGIAKKETGSYGQANEYDVDVSFIGNVTPAIYAKNLIHQSMGTRFLYYEINDFQEKEVMEKIWENSDTGESEKSREIAEVIENFLYEAKTRDVENPPEEVKTEIERVAKWTAKMRASGQFDRGTNELRSSVTPEKHSRIVKQYKKIYENLKKLEENYSDERALKIIRRIGASSIDPEKRQIFIEVDSTDQSLTLSQIISRMGVGRKAIKRRLLEMENVDIMDTSITYREETDQMSYDSWRVEENFSGLSEDLVPA